MLGIAAVSVYEFLIAGMQHSQVGLLVMQCRLLKQRLGPGAYKYYQVRIAYVGGARVVPIKAHCRIMADLEAAKKRLSEVLRDSIQKYWDLMKSWYRRKVPVSFD